MSARAITLGPGPWSPTRSRTGALVGVAVGGIAAGLLGMSPKVALVGFAAVLVPGAAILSGRPQRFLWLLLVAAVPIHVDLELVTHPEHYTGARSFYLDAVTLVAASLAAIALVRGLARRDPVPRLRTPVWPALAAYLLVVAATVPGSTRPLLGAMELVRMLEELLLVVVVSHLLRTREDVVFLAVAMLAVMFGETLIGLLQFRFPGFVDLSFFGGAVSTWVEEFGRGAHRRVAGTYLHPALFGSYLVVHLSLALALFLAVGRGLARAALAGIFLLGFAALVLTFSRIEWLGFVVATAAVVLLAARAGLLSRRALVWVAGIGAALAGVTLLFSGLIATRLLESDPANLAERLASYQDASRMFLAHPLRGVGLNNYMEAVAHFPGASAQPIPVHNYFLMVLAETGAPGLCAFVALLLAIAWEARHGLRARDRLLRAIAIGLLAGVAAFVVDFFSTFTLRFSAMSTLFWLMVGLLIAISALARRDEAFA